MPTPDKWQQEVDEALFGTDKAEASPDLRETALPPTPEAGSGRRDEDVGADLFGEDDLRAVVAPVGEHVAWQPASSSGTQSPRAVDVDAVEAALFGGAATSAPSAPAATKPAAPPIELPVVDEAEAARPTGPGRGPRRVWVLAAFTALVVIIGATAGAVIAGRSGTTRPGRKTVSDHTTATTATTAPVVTTTPVQATVPATTASPPTPTTPRTTATTRRTVPPPQPSVESEPPPPAPPPEPPPSEPPPSTSVPP